MKKPKEEMCGEMNDAGKKEVCFLLYASCFVVPEHKILLHKFPIIKNQN